MPEEIIRLFAIVCLSLIISAVFVAIGLIWRLIRKKPLLPKKSKIESPLQIYVVIAGIIFCGGLSLATFLNGLPYFGFTFLLMMLGFIAFVVAYKKGWRG
jgi:hypothetical protein